MMSDFYLAVETQFYLSVKIIEDNANADGKSENILEIYCLDDDFYPARGIDILVRVDGSALIPQSGGFQAYHGFTDAVGKLRVAIADDTDEKVTATIEAFGYPETRQEKTLNFIEDRGAFAITEAINANQSFLTVGEPSTAWPGASFIIKVQGGSGNVAWRVAQSSAEVTIEGSPDGNGIVTIRTRPRQICLIEGVDTLTKESVTYSFHITLFVDLDNNLRIASQAHSLYGGNLLRYDECRSIYNQWGNMTSYVPWEPSYWAIESDLFSNALFNFDAGNHLMVSSSWKVRTVYKIG